VRAIRLSHRLDELDDMMARINGGPCEGSFPEVFHLLAALFRERSDQEIEDELFESFRFFDGDRDGFITTQELRTLLVALDLNAPAKAVSLMVDEADRRICEREHSESLRWSLFALEKRLDGTPLLWPGVLRQQWWQGFCVGAAAAVSGSSVAVAVVLVEARERLIVSSRRRGLGRHCSRAA
jgi:Ca2+-binding EF-hand superfamily protein